MTRAERSILGLLRDETTALDLRALGPRQSRRLHRNNRGNISVLFILLAFVFYGSASLVWNTGHAVAAKMHTQTAADAGAYSAAVWTSRTMNMITGTNMMILRNHGAQVSAASAVAVTIGVPIFWAAEIARAVGCAPPPFNVPCIVAAVARVAVEIPPYASFVGNSAGQSFGNLFSNTFPNRINEIHDFQRELVSEIPDTIEAQERNLERYYGVDIRFTVPGRSDGRVTPPLEEGNFVQTAALVAARWFIQDNNWPDEGNFSGFNSVGRSRTIWTATNVVTIAAMSAVHASDNYVLPTQLVFLEIGPESLSERQPYTIVATAIERNASGGFLSMPGLFDSPIHPNDTVIAYAQAETVNGISERLNHFPIPIPFPFRVWTTYGWQWQPRLTRGDQFRSAFSNDAGMRGLYAPIGVTRADEGNFSDIAHH
ncbi:MAG: pilus assembly protein TadG-related protein [Phycisphaerales bacterium]